MLKRMLFIIALMLALFMAPIAAVSGSHVNINSADAEQLATLPGIGPSLADRIIQYRAEFPFETPEDIMKVSGIGESTFNNIKDLIKVE